MATPLQNNSNLELGNFFIKYFWQSAELMDTNLHLDDTDDKARVDEERLQEWRRNITKIRQSY